MDRRTALFGMISGLTFVSPATACINHYHRDEDTPHRAPPNRPAEFMAQLQGHPEHDRMVTGPAPTDPGATADFRKRSDYAAVLIHRGDSRKAVEILESIERSNPGEYRVAANLGTAYELSGDLDKARQWIREGMRRNPQSHHGTEWLHLRILDARQALARNPQWLKSNSVTGLDFGVEAKPRVPTRWPENSGSAEDVIRALIYQLHERMAFVPAPDPLVGSLISDLGSMLMIYRTVDVAIPVFDLALAYRPLGVHRVAERKSLSEEIVRSRTDTPSDLRLGLIGIATLTIGAAAVLKLRHPG
jgi:tetratricopeptide (TPR) repeat protein